MLNRCFAEVQMSACALSRSCSQRVRVSARACWFCVDLPTVNQNTCTLFMSVTRTTVRCKGKLANLLSLENPHSFKDSCAHPEWKLTLGGRTPLFFVRTPELPSQLFQEISFIFCTVSAISLHKLQTRIPGAHFCL